MAKIENSVSVNVSADEAWKVVSDFEGIHQWFAMADSCRLEGDDRHIGMAGMDDPVIERRLKSDDETRTLVYTIVTSPLPTESYEATWTVEPEGDGARLTWAMEFEPEEVGELLGSIAQGGLNDMKAYLEGS